MAKSKFEPTAKLYKVDGTVEDVLPAKGKKFKNKELHELLNVETLGLVFLQGPGLQTLVVLCDDEGKLKPDAAERVNLKATEVWESYYGRTDVLVGDILICSKNYT